MPARRARVLLTPLVGAVAAALVWGASSAMAALNGPDVSSYQHPLGVSVDWAGVSTSGAAFAFVKATEGTGYTNPYFARDWAALGSTGTIRGAYHFARPSNIAGSAVQQAQHFAAAAGTLQTAGDLAPVLDLEVTGGLSPAALSTWAHTYLSTVAALTHRTPILYTYPAFWSGAMAGDRTFASYPLWIASYSSQKPAPVGGWGTYAFWQYTDSGTVAGIPTPVDVSVFNGTLDELRAMALLPPLTAAPPSPTTTAPTSPSPGVPTSATASPAPSPTTPTTPRPSSPAPSAPAGAWDTATASPGGLRLTGWAVDPNTVPRPTRVQVRLDGRPLVVRTASVPSPELLAAHSSWGGAHGFDISLSGLRPGTHQLCVSALAASGSAATPLGCVRRVVMGDPKIAVSATRVGSRIDVEGWAVDPQTAAPVTIRVRVPGRSVQTLRADRLGPAPTGTWGPWGPDHGYATQISSSRAIPVCLTYVNVSYGNDRTVCLTR